MKRGRSTGNPTIAQARRHAAIREAGCVVAFKLGIGHIPCEIHHLTIGGKHGSKRMGHDQVVGLNSWSHRGEPIYGWSAEECREKLGPSYAREPRAFREQIGRDHQLIELQNSLLGEE